MGKLNDLVKKSALLGAFILGGVWIANLVFQAIGNPAKYLFSSVSINIPQPYNPITPTVANKILAWLGGYITMPALPELAIIWVSATIIVMVGMVLKDFLKISVGNDTMGIFKTILIGAIPFYIWIVGFVLPQFDVAIGLILYTLIASYLAALLGKMIKINI